MPRRFSKEYQREQRREMIRTLQSSKTYWKYQSEINHRRAEELSAILGGDPGDSLSEVLQTYKNWAAEADASLRRVERELKEWKAKKI